MSDNDVRITVGADNRTTAAFGEAARGARTVGDAVQNTNRAFREADNRYQQASLRLQQLAARQREAAERAQRLAHEQLQLRVSIAAAGSATAEQTQRLERLTRQQNEATISARLLAGQHRSSTEQVNDLARAYQRAQNNAQQALRASLMFGAGARLGPDGSVGGSGPGSGPNGLMRLLARLPGMGGLAASTGAQGAGAATGNPVVGAGLLGLGAAAVGLGAPLIGGVVTGAVGAAGAFGGVGLGVAGAIANDPKAFDAQWSEVTGRVTARWQKASASWVLPLHDAIRDVDGMMRKLPIESVLQNSAGYLAPLTKGLTGFGEGIFEGLDRLIDRAGPIVDVLETRLPKLGHDLGGMFAAFGEGAEGGAVALDDFLYALGRMTRGVGVTFAALARMYGGIHDGVAWFGDLAESSADFVGGLLEHIPVLDRYADGVKRLFDDQPDKVPSFAQRLPGAPAVDPVAEQVARYPGVFKLASAAVDGLIDKLHELRSVALESANANVALAQGWLDLNAELRDGKRVLDLTSQAGIDNQKALLDQVAAAEAVRQQQIELTGNLASANAAYDANIERIRQMAYNLGYNRDAVDRLINSLSGLDSTSATPEVQLKGASTAYEWAQKTRSALEGLRQTFTARIAVSAPAGISIGNLQHHAAGGATSGASVVNDWGPGTGELIRTPDGSTVIPAGTGRAMMQNLAGSAAGAQRITLEIVSDGGDLADMLAKHVRVRGGDVQLAIMGRPRPPGSR